VDSGEHQPLQREGRGGRKQRRQRAMRDLSQQKATRTRKVDPGDLQNIVASRVVEFARRERIVPLVAVPWRGFQRLLERIRSAGNW
jgi:hypothetical protein